MGKPYLMYLDYKIIGQIATQEFKMKRNLNKTNYRKHNSNTTALYSRQVILL